MNIKYLHKEVIKVDTSKTTFVHKRFELIETRVKINHPLEKN